jgi:hypothetical protein
MNDRYRTAQAKSPEYEGKAERRERRRPIYLYSMSAAFVPAKRLARNFSWPTD